MLAGHVEAELFGRLDVEAKRLIGRRGVETIGPEALIERAGHEDRLAVEKDAVDSLLIFLEGDSALPEIARQLIFGAVVSAKLDFQAVEEWRLWRPQLCLRQRNCDWLIGSRFMRSSFCITIHDGDTRSARRGDIQIDIDRFAVGVGADMNSIDMTGRHRLDPD